MNSLQQEIEAGRTTVRAEGYSMSIGEIANLYDNQELVIRPEFQRLFRWDIEQKSRLIESILLGIPLPSFFVMQREDGVWEVIDGLQRMSTILEFMGVLRDEETGAILPGSVLKATGYLPSISGHRFQAQNEGELELTSGQRIAFKRSKLDMKILQPESDDKAKFELFDRLNAGGATLTPQEIRNAQLIMRDAETYEWIVRLRDLDDFQAIVSISDRKLREQYDVELVCRAIAIGLSTEEQLRDLGNMDRFLTATILSLPDREAFDREGTGLLFSNVMTLVRKSLEDNAFRRYDSATDRFLGPFSVAAFEAVVAGLWENIELWERQSPEKLAAKIKTLWSTEFTAMSGTGIAASARVPKLTPWARRFFSAVDES